MTARVDDHGAMPRVRSPIRRGRWLLTGLVLLLLAIGSILAARGGAQEVPRPLLLLISIALAIEPGNGIDRVLEADVLHRRGGFPTASFLVGLKPGWRTGSSLTGTVRSTVKPGGTHGHLPDLPELRASFFLIGPGVPAARSLGIIDMRDVAPTLARRLGLTLPTADGKILLP